MSKKYPKEFKYTFLDYMKKGESISQLSLKFSIPKSTVYDWIKQHKKLKSNDSKCEITYRQYYDLERKLDLKTKELEILLKSKCLPSTTKIEKMKAIQRLIDEYPVRTMCRILEVNYSTFYNFHLRKPEQTIFQIKDADLKPLIKNIFDKSGQRFGSKKIRAKLIDDGHVVSPEKVSNLMKQLNLIPLISKQRRKHSKQNVNWKLVNRLKREFTQFEPNRVWVSDITTIRIKGNHFYLCVIIDLFSRKVIAHRCSYQNNTNLTMNTFKDAFSSRNDPSSLTFHSDRGSNYTAYEFQQLLKVLGVIQSFSNTSTPYDNAVAESFFSYLKKEEINRKQILSYDELKESVSNYLDFYNDYRPHEAINNVTPNHFEALYNKKPSGNSR